MGDCVHTYVTRGQFRIDFGFSGQFKLNPILETGHYLKPKCDPFGKLVDPNSKFPKMGWVSSWSWLIIIILCSVFLSVAMSVVILDAISSFMVLVAVISSNEELIILLIMKVECQTNIRDNL
ncbi:hypothetical protein IEQ34_020188 [Dendrobium chrysotoxum]|uniref:Transmembrane protein n=1 Tax=Dendrobium chrysotoxum TaxID=161865 RepID=A0AAV7G097_DENCH|nr:hypothetical protein IEQ34_020188 [Dendrobium chrysotoxum]